MDQSGVGPHRDGTGVASIIASMDRTHAIYTPAAVRELDRITIEEIGVPGYQLMCRAGEAAFEAARSRFPDVRRWLVLCGAGNNAGDGYVIARLACEAQLEVTVVALADPEAFGGDAALAWRDYRACGGDVVEFDESVLSGAELVVDALLGTGLDRPVEGAWRAAIEAVTASGLPVIAVDIPSGLNGLTGEVMGSAIRATVTATFVGLKQGFYLDAGPDCTGEIVYDALGVPDEAFARVGASMRRFDEAGLPGLLPRRPATAHKGLFGHVLVIGGNHGMGGAVRMAGEAALRAGAGLVSVATRPENIAAATSYRPELMCHGIVEPAGLEPLLARASVIALGPGLGRDDWASGLFDAALGAAVPLVIDADGLNILAETPQQRDDWVLTPHPGEAGRLLGIDAATVQGGRLEALAGLCERYGGVAVLKGCGTLIGHADALPHLVDRGNPAMASAGMGDVLTGLIAGVAAQLPGDLHAAAAAGAFVHAMAGDVAAEGRERGLLATDLLAHVSTCLNPPR